MIRQACMDDSAVLAEMALYIWRNNTAAALEREFSRIAESEDSVCYIQYLCDIPIGFAMCSLRRDYVEGTTTSPVGYLEGIYVQNEYRNRGYAKELLAACEAWAKTKGCMEFASDCECDNTNSFNFHMAMGFSEANRVICFTKHI